MKRVLSTAIFTLVLAAGATLPSAFAADLRTTGGPPASYRHSATVSPFKAQVEHADLSQVKDKTAMPMSIEAQVEPQPLAGNDDSAECNFRYPGQSGADWSAREAAHNCQFGL